MLTLFLHPLARWGALVAVILMVIAGAFFGVKNAIRERDDAIRQEVHRDYEVRDLKQAVTDAEEDRVFAEGQAAKSAAEAATLRKDLSAMRDRVGQARSSIHGGVASGELANGQLSPVIEQTISEIDTMQREAAK